MNASVRLPPPLRALFALWLLLGLLVAPVQAARHAGAMASGQLVCSAAGAYVVGADGELLPAEGLGGHDCCLAAAGAPPPALPAIAGAACQTAAPQAWSATPHDAAPRALPLARGPPAARPAQPAFVR